MRAPSLVIILSLFMLPVSANSAETRDEPRVASPDPASYVSPSRPFETLHTALDLDIDLRRQQIAGSVTHRMKSLADDLGVISLNCVELNVSEVLVNSQLVQFDYPVAGQLQSTWIGSLTTTNASDLLVIRPNRKFSYGEEFTVTVRYSGAPKKGLYWVQPEKGIKEKRYEVWAQGEGEDNRYWIPSHDYPNDLATYEGRYRVDKGYYVFSNGNLISQNDVGGKTEFHWKLDQPHVNYLITIAAAKYDIFEENHNGIKLMYVVPPGTDRATVDRGYGLTGKMIDFFNETIGVRYPYDKYGQVVVQNFIYGGMENTTATVMNMRTLYDERAGLTGDEQDLVAHEVAHQWFGDYVTCREWTHLWLNEGFATYYQSLFRGHHEGDGSMRYEFNTRHRTIVGRDDNDRRPMVVDFHNRTGSRNNSNIYIKGASVLHMLRFQLGDANYHRAVKRYLDMRGFNTAVTTDLMRAVSETTGQNLDWFFEQWVFLAGHPKLSVSKSWDDNKKTLKLTVKQTQKIDERTPLFRLPLDVEITTAKGATIHRIEIDSKEQDFHFSCDARPEMVIFDKGDWTLKELTFKKPNAEWLYQLKNGDYIAQVRAAHALGKSGDRTDVVTALRQTMLADGHYGLRRESALALGQIGTRNAREALFEGIRTSDARVRLAAAEALGEFDRDETAATELYRLLRSDDAYGVRARAVASLVAMNSSKAEDACLAAIKQESFGSVVRSAGLDGLATLKATNRLDVVARYAVSGNVRAHRHRAMTAYARLARDEGSDAVKRKAVRFLAGMKDDWYIRTRQNLIRSIETVGHSDGVAVLEDIAANDVLEDLRSQAAAAARRLARNADADPAVKRIERLEDELDKLRREMDKMSAQQGANDDV